MPSNTQEAKRPSTTDEMTLRSVEQLFERLFPADIERDAPAKTERAKYDP
jgi:hypothetical protein